MLTLAAASLQACQPAQVAAPAVLPEARTPAETGQSCGGVADTVCGSDANYCRMDTGVCALPEASGTCAPKPDMHGPFSADAILWCGCDGEDYVGGYGYALAASRDVNIQSVGTCASSF